MVVRSCIAILIGGTLIGAAIGQSTPNPVPGLLSAPKQRKEPLSDVTERAKQSVLAELRSVGGNTSKEALALQSLPAAKFIERLAVSPLVGPSSIAPPKPGAPTPSPSVNTSNGGGATTAHAGVALLLARESGQAQFGVQCSGTLIRQNVVLTAAHCVCYSYDESKNYASGRECVHGTETRAPASLMNASNWRVFFQHVGMREVRSVVVNEGYRFDGKAVRDDLALLVLKQSATEIIPPDLPPASSPAMPWTSGRIVGYGFSSADDPAAAVLKQLVQPGIKAHGKVASGSCQGLPYLDPASSLCSLFSDTTNGSVSTVCGGDSGGPLWQSDANGSTIGVTSGRSDSDCRVKGTIGFQMATSFREHRMWIDERLKTFGVASEKGKWPAFGDNLLAVLDRRNSVPFNASGTYESEGWILSQVATPILATINSSGAIDEFSVQDRKGRVLCRGAAGAKGDIPNVDFCWASVLPGTQFRIVAKGTKDEYLQYVVTTHASLPK